MPNGGTDCCMNCFHNRVNQSPENLKTFTPGLRVAYCALRHVLIYSHAWTYCANMTSRRHAKHEVEGFIHASGLFEGGYSRVPWLNRIEPRVRDKRITIDVDGQQYSFDNNADYVDWVRSIKSPETHKKTSGSFLSDIECNDTDAVSHALSNGVDVNACDDYQWSALHLAARNGSVEVANILIRNGADIRAQSLCRWTPLETAAYWGHGNIVRLLCDAETDPTFKKRIGMRAVKLAASEGHKGIVDLLLPVSFVNDHEKEEALLRSAEHGNLYLVETLVNAGVNINCRDEQGWTPLLRAVYGPHVNVAIFLLDQGADISLENDIGYTAKSIVDTWHSSKPHIIGEIVEEHLRRQGL